jgi:hypothetical protein
MPRTILYPLRFFSRIHETPKQRRTMLHRALNEPPRGAFRQQEPEIPKIIPTRVDPFASGRVVKTEQKSFFVTHTLPPTPNWLVVY